MSYEHIPSFSPFNPLNPATAAHVCMSIATYFLKLSIAPQ